MFIASLSHPPYGTSWIENPTTDHVDRAFRDAAEHGLERVGDIWITWDLVSHDVKAVDARDLLFAVSKEHDCCFVARLTSATGHY